jgi:hypothetical protein
MNSPAIASVPNIDDRMNRLKDVTNTIDNLLNELASRLAPVLLPQNSAVAAGEGASVKAKDQSPLANQIDLVVDSLDQQAGYLRFLINRLEV